MKSPSHLYKTYCMAVIIAQNSVSDLLSTGTYNRPAKIPFIKSIIAISGSLLLFIVQSFYYIILKNIVKQEWKSSKKSLAVQYNNKTALLCRFSTCRNPA